jgi:hypothetical protein
MGAQVEHKLYAGFRGFMLRIPPLLSELGSKRGAKGAKTNAAHLTVEERNVHHHIVRKMAQVREPFTAATVAAEMGINSARMNAVVDKLESMKTFIYRSDGQGIDWAYPLSLQDTGFTVTTTSGERFFAA